MKKNVKGFTLIELIVVIAIIGILASVLSIALVGYIHDSKISKAQSDARAINNYVYTRLYSTAVTEPMKAYVKTHANASGFGQIVYQGKSDSCHGTGDFLDEMISGIGKANYEYGFVVFYSEAATDIPKIDGVYMYVDDPTKATSADNTLPPDADYPQKVFEDLKTKTRT